MRSGGVSTVSEKTTQLNVNFECGGTIGFSGRGEIGAEETDGELR